MAPSKAKLWLYRVWVNLYKGLQGINYTTSVWNFCWCVSVSIKHWWRVSFESAIRGITDDVNPLHFLLDLASSNINFFLLSFHCGWMIWGVGVGRELLKCCGNCCDSKRDAGLLSIECVVWVLRVWFNPPANVWTVVYSSFIGLPLVLSPEEFDPVVGFICMDEFKRSMCFPRGVNIVPSIGVSWSLIVEVLRSKGLKDTTCVSGLVTTGIAQWGILLRQWSCE